MSERKVRICDLCGRDEDKTLVSRLIVEYDRGMFGAPSSESYYKNVDVCHNCLVNIVKTHVNGLPMKDRLPFLRMKDMTADGRNR